MQGLNIGFALCGSYCTFSEVFPVIGEFVARGAEVVPIMSYNVFTTDTRFGKAEDFAAELLEITGNRVIHTIAEAEPIGPGKLLDALVIAPCTGNTLAKLASGIADTSVTLAAKAHLRNSRPLIIAVSTNDGLASAAKNIGMLQNMKNIYFAPYGQDDSQSKPSSLVARFLSLPETVEAALEHRQLQPMLL